jgi:exodeoxyribonuclease VII small subunit
MAVKKSFETALKRLEEAVAQLEGGELPLDQALKVFSEGVKQAGICRQSLGEVDLQVEQLLKQADGSLKREKFDEQP